MLEGRTTQEILQIVSAGAGLEISLGGRPIQDILLIVTAARAAGSQIFVRGLGGKSTQELLQIAAAGKGSVVFAESLPNN